MIPKPARFFLKRVLWGDLQPFRDGDVYLKVTDSDPHPLIGPYVYYGMVEPENIIVPVPLSVGPKFVIPSIRFKPTWYVRVRSAQKISSAEAPPRERPITETYRDLKMPVLIELAKPNKFIEGNVLKLTNHLSCIEMCTEGHIRNTALEILGECSHLSKK